MDKIKKFLYTDSYKLILLGLLSLFLACLTKTYDYDLFARLIVGEHFFANWNVSYHDFLSYTPTHIWYDHEWGASVIFYAFFKLFGAFGLILCQAMTLFITALFVIKTQRLQKKTFPISLTFMSGFLCLYAYQNPTIVRCHMFSFMFFSILIYLLEKTRKKNSNIIYLAVPLITIWNNIHGGVVSGLGIIFIYMISEFISKRNWKKYFYTLLISTPLLAINPYGFEYLNFLISANTKFRKYITEWWPVFAYRHVGYYYPQFCLALFTLTLTTIRSIQKKDFDLTKIIALLTTTILGIAHVKLLSLPLILIAALCYNDILTLFKKNHVKLLEKMVYIIIPITLICLPFTTPHIAKVDPFKFPVKEVEFLKINNIKGNILCNFGIGSYISYKLYPNNLIFMDGRYEEVYYDKEFDKLLLFEGGLDGWEILTKEYPTEIIIAMKTQDSYKKIKSNRDWEEVYHWNSSGVFLKKNRKKYKDKFLLPSDEMNYYQKTAFDNFGKFTK